LLTALLAAVFLPNDHTTVCVTSTSGNVWYSEYSLGGWEWESHDGRRCYYGATGRVVPQLVACPSVKRIDVAIFASDVDHVIDDCWGRPHLTFSRKIPELLAVSRIDSVNRAA
jgi:hypothetical protein